MTRFPWRMTWLTAAVAAAGLAIGVAMAQPAAAPAPVAPVAVPAAMTAANQPPDLAAVAAAGGMSMREAWTCGGWIMWVLAGLSVAGLALVFYQVMVFRESRVAPRDLLGDVVGRIRGGELNEARRLCEEQPCALSAVALVAFDQLRHAPKDTLPLLRDGVEAEGARHADAMSSQVQWLLDLAVIAPMLGLLGTVLGMLQAFGAVAHDIAGAKPVVLAAGVTKAIVTTIFGLFVAIPAMGCYAWLRRRVARLIAQLEAAAAEITMALAGRYDR